MGGGVEGIEAKKGIQSRESYSLLMKKWENQACICSSSRGWQMVAVFPRDDDKARSSDAELREQCIVIFINHGDLIT